jgi:hypothetical protein
MGKNDMIEYLPKSSIKSSGSSDSSMSERTVLRKCGVAQCANIVAICAASDHGSVRLWPQRRPATTGLRTTAL